jgi:acetolactate synthase-1/2/3 large subunit
MRVGTSAALRALLTERVAPLDLDRQWHEAMAVANAGRSQALAATIKAAEAGSDGRMHPYCLIAALNQVIDQETIIVVDGGDVLSFARIALSAPTYLDPGPLGCLGVGVPFATSAAINFPDRPVVALIGDGSFGFTAIEIDTAVRLRARAVFVVANNEGWNIERHDQLRNYGGRVVGSQLPGCRYDLLARALGAYGERVESPHELPGALKRAQTEAPAVLDVLVTRDAVSPDFAGGLARAPDRQALTAWDDAERRRLAGS